MITEFNIYCDESCHLENDGINVMTLGAIWCPKDSVIEISKDIKDIKEKHGISRYAEIKWTKVSDSKLDFYLELVDYFFERNDMHFRVLIIPDKSSLQHDKFGHTHDEFYYKMYFNLLKVIWQKDSNYYVYLDIKDTNGNNKVKKLHKVLCNQKYDYKYEVISKIQQVRSHEVVVLQITDLLIGAVTYENRGLKSSTAKLKVIERIKERSGFCLKESTFCSETKFNVFRWVSNYGL
jgi:hypothetical protein